METAQYFDKEMVEQHQEKCLMELKNYNKSKRVMKPKHKEFKPFDKVLVRDSIALNAAWHCDFYSDYNYSIADEENRHYTVSGGRYTDNNILPYEGNEELVGTTDEPQIPLSEKEIQDAYWKNCTEKEKENLRKSYNVFLKDDERGKLILEKTCGKHNLQDDFPDEEVKLEKGERIVCNNDVELLMEGVGFITTYSFLSTDVFFTGTGRFIHADYNYAIRFSDFNPDDMEETKNHILCVMNGKVLKYKHYENK